MKSSAFFCLLLIFSVSVHAKNKILYGIALEEGTNTVDLYMVIDHKRPLAKSKIDSQVKKYASTSDFIIYQKSDGTVYVITDFISLFKTNLGQYSSFTVNNGSIFLEQSIQLANKKFKSNVFMITDFKTLQKQQVLTEIDNWAADKSEN